MTTNPYDSPKTEGYSPPKTTNPWSLFRVLAIVGILGLLVVFLLLPNVRSAPEAARRMQCGNHLKQIGIALHNYADDYHSLPPAYTVDAAGNRLHSWRTLILPYCEGKKTYDSIDLSKPWDDPVNQPAHNAAPPAYLCPSASIPQDKTTYLAVAIAGACFQQDKPTPLAAITDSKSLTLLVIEVPDDHAVHWMSPRDIDEALLAKLTGPVKSSHPNGALAVFADGHTQMLRHDLKPETLRAMISFAGNDDIVAQEGY